QFQASGGNVFAWDPAPVFSNASAANPKAIINASTTYSVQISDPSCGRDTIIFIPIVASSEADIKVFKQNDVSCSNDSTVLIATGGVSYTWYPSDYIVRNSNGQVTVKPPVSTTYTVTGTSAAGCTGSDTVTVYFNKEGEQRLFVPNAFTPNQDGLNDFFRPVLVGPHTKYTFRIFNRWGQLIFQTNTPGKGWNGYVGSVLQEAGVYVYTVEADGMCNGNFFNKGTFALIR
ncbi:MAG TPA: gliding motility-associated C-terminal domain-containing protein, partial [Flavisolibacter sp.]